MCLTRVDKIFDPPKKEEVRGWKFFEYDIGGIRFPYYSLNDTFDVLINKWIESYGNIPPREDEINYPKGFHIFLEKRDAESWAENFGTQAIVLPVVARKILVEGYQGAAETIVAKEMLVEM